MTMAFTFPPLSARSSPTSRWPARGNCVVWIHPSPVLHRFFILGESLVTESLWLAYGQCSRITKDFMMTLGENPSSSSSIQQPTQKWVIARVHGIDFGTLSLLE
jgi:hypothetical protein